MKKKCTCNPYEGGELPPCSDFLGNSNPIIKDGKVIFRNFNRVFYFITTTPDNTTTLSDNVFYSYTNIQISLYNFIIGIFISQIESKLIDYDKNCAIHKDTKVNKFIHEILQKKTEIKLNSTPSLSLIVSNNNAIVPLLTTMINISPINYFILLVLNRFEGNPALFFADNTYTLEDPINFYLSGLNVQCINKGRR